MVRHCSPEEVSGDDDDRVERVEKIQRIMALGQADSDEDPTLELRESPDFDASADYVDDHEHADEVAEVEHAELEKLSSTR